MMIKEAKPEKIVRFIKTPPTGSLIKVYHNEKQLVSFGYVNRVKFIAKKYSYDNSTERCVKHQSVEVLVLTPVRPEYVNEHEIVRYLDQSRVIYHTEPFKIKNTAFYELKKH